MRCTLAWWLVLGAIAACGNDHAADLLDAAPPSDGPGLTDIRLPIPAPDPKYIDLVTPEVVIQPGEERMYCYHLQNDAGDMAIGAAFGSQGGIGSHHIALFATSDPRPAGTLEDCTSPQANAKLQWFILFLGGLPPGHGIRIPQGMHYVLQFHYINSTDFPLLVRDVARLERVDPASVTTWVSTLISTKIDLDLPPGRTTVSWDCTMDQDRDLLVVVGHMHEIGARFTIDIGPTASELTNLYTADPWQGWFRDNPPVKFFYEQPIRLAKGSVLRTTCEWVNTGTRPVGFPAEMCTTFAYAAGAQQLLQCEPSN
jgi:hypothetical protein